MFSMSFKSAIRACNSFCLQINWYLSWRLFTFIKSSSTRHLGRLTLPTLEL
eukprot:14513.XXX_606040_606192_1 [CDS] Oithona nana genome sequencing.